MADYLGLELHPEEFLTREIRRGVLNVVADAIMAFHRDVASRCTPGLEDMGEGMGVGEEMRRKKD